MESQPNLLVQLTHMHAYISLLFAQDKNWRRIPNRRPRGMEQVSACTRQYLQLWVSMWFDNNTSICHHCSILMLRNSLLFVYQSCLCHQECKEDERAIQIYRSWARCLQNHVRVEEKERNGLLQARVSRGNSSWRIMDYDAAEILEAMHTEVVCPS